MPNIIAKIFTNSKIPQRKRVLGPTSSAIVSFLLPGSAQAINGQYTKGCILMLLWLGLYSIADASQLLRSIIAVSQFLLRIVISSDAYFISSRMKLGEEVRKWSVLFFNMEPPTKQATSMNHDYYGKRTLITDANIIDGTGMPPFCADVLIEGEVIKYMRSHIEREGKDYSVVNGTGLYLIPGFINPCCSMESNLFCNQDSTFSIRQGFTTEIAGQGGHSLSPVNDDCREECAQMFREIHGNQTPENSFNNTGTYLMELERLQTASRYESVVGYSTLRKTTLGQKETALNESDIERICNRVKSTIECGAKGISFRLADCAAANITDLELITVFKTIQKLNSIVTIQLPAEEGTLIDSISRVCSLVEKSGVNIQVINVHAVGEDRKKADLFCAVVENANSRGAKITLCTTGFPYSICSLAPIKSSIAEIGGAGMIRVASLKEKSMEWMVGKTLEDISREAGCTPEDAAETILSKNDNDVSVIVTFDDGDFTMSLISKPYTFLCTDDRPYEQMDFILPYYLGCFLRENLPLEEAVHRNTMQLAAIYKMWDRGIIREGMIADLVLIDPKHLPREFCDGMMHGIKKVWSSGLLQFDSEPNFDTAALQGRKIMGISIGR